MSLFSPASLARASARHPWRVLGAWVVILVLAVMSASGLGDALTTTSNFTGKPESQVGADLLKDRMRGDKPATETIIVRSETMTVDDPGFQAVVEKTSSDVLAMSGVVASAPTYYQAVAKGDTSAGHLVSADRHATIIPVTFAGTMDEVDNHVDAYLATVKQHASANVQVMTVGELSVSDEFNTISSHDLEKGEMFSLPLTILILVVVFGALLAVGVPLMLAVVSIILALGLTAVVGRFTDLSFYVINMITMIGLAVGIDYTLFVVSRYREERQRGHAKLDAIEIAGGTATKAVVFSGGTVVLALMGMFLVPLTVFHSLGAGAVLAAVSAVAGTLTLVPAMLGLLGDKIDWPRKRRYDDASVRAAYQAHANETYHAGFWGRITRLVMARPAVFTVLSIGLLVALALPYVDIHRGQAGIETLPASDVKTAYEILGRDFSVGLADPVEIVVDGEINDPAIQASIAALQQALAANPDFGTSTVEVNRTGDLALITTPLGLPSDSEAGTAAIWNLRNNVIPQAFSTSAHASVYVSGGPGFNTDYFHIVDSSTPTVFGFVLGLSFLLLLLAFRSIVIAAKAIVLNLLSVGAAYGAMVLVFQKGYGADLFGFQKSPTIEAWIPIFLFCVLFGLSMDYHVFLLSRIREHFDQTRRNTESVAVGLQSTARIITGAALIMVVVFGGFATGELVAFQQMGFGMAVAVFLDATVVRTILVPAAMALLGDRNWYLPTWLRWLPNVSVEGAPVAAPALTASAAD
jgi:RND superfamily putative drug exporter